MNKVNQVFVVDDDVAVTDSLAMLLDVAGFHVSTFQRATDFLDACTPGTMGCIILDVNMPEMDGPTLQEELTRRGMQMPIIFLSGQGTIPITVRTIKAGAMDFLTKPVNGSILLTRVQEAVKQCSIQQKKTQTSKLHSARLATLTEREREIMQLVVAGHTSKEIAQRLNISYRTVEIHRAHIMQKTDSSNMLELARLATIPPPQ